MSACNSFFSSRNSTLSAHSKAISDCSPVLSTCNSVLSIPKAQLFPRTYRSDFFCWSPQFSFSVSSNFRFTGAVLSAHSLMLTPTLLHPQCPTPTSQVHASSFLCLESIYAIACPPSSQCPIAIACPPICCSHMWIPSSVFPASASALSSTLACQGFRVCSISYYW